MKENSQWAHNSCLFSALSVSLKSKMLAKSLKRGREVFLKSKILAKSLKRGSREIFDPRNRDTKGFLGRCLVADVGPLVLDQY